MHPAAWNAPLERPVAFFPVLTEPLLAASVFFAVAAISGSIFVNPSTYWFKSIESDTTVRRSAICSDVNDFTNFCPRVDLFFDISWPMTILSFYEPYGVAFLWYRVCRIFFMSPLSLLLRIWRIYGLFTKNRLVVQQTPPVLFIHSTLARLAHLWRVSIWADNRPLAPYHGVR